HRIHPDHMVQPWFWISFTELLDELIEHVKVNHTQNRCRNAKCPFQLYNFRAALGCVGGAGIYHVPDLSSRVGHYKTTPILTPASNGSFLREDQHGVSDFAQ